MEDYEELLDETYSYIRVRASPILVEAHCDE
jgi:hypothetical protein